MQWVNLFLSGQGRTSAPAPAANVTPSVAAVLAPVSVPTSSVAPKPISEAQLAAQFAKWPALSVGVKFERFRDGFAINGQRYIDPEGSIVSYGFDEQSGWAGMTDEPVLVATAERRGASGTSNRQPDRSSRGAA